MHSEIQRRLFLNATIENRVDVVKARANKRTDTVLAMSK